MNVNLAYAFAVGMVATVNPCGFAMLPAYLSAFVGLDDRSSRFSAVGRALVVSAVMTLGFITVFGLFGAVISKLSSGIQEQMPWVTIVIGIALVGLGIYLLTGREIVVNIPKLNRGGADGTLVSMFLFGVSYAIASLSCTMPAFMAATASSFQRHGFLAGVASFIAYGVGMGVVIVVLTVAVALAKEGIVNRFRAFLPVVNRVAGGLLVIAGAYVAYYGWYEIATFRGGGTGDDPVVKAAQRIQRSISTWVDRNHTTIGVLAAVVVAAALGWLAWRRRPVARDTAP